MKFPFHPRAAILPALTAALLLAQAQSTQAVLTMEVRASSILPEYGTVLDAKTVQLYPNAVGADLILELWAVVKGTDGNGTNESLSTVMGSLVSSPGTVPNRDTGVAGNQALLVSPNTVHGNLSNALIGSWLTGPIPSNGIPTDLDFDGDLDVGSLDATPVSPGYIRPRAVAPQTGAGLDETMFHQLSDGREFKVSVATFRVTDLVENGSTGVNFLFPRFLTPVQEGTRVTSTADGVPVNGLDANLAVGAPVLINVVPEPATAGLICSGVGFLLWGRRRRPSRPL